LVILSLGNTDYGAEQVLEKRYLAAFAGNRKNGIAPYGTS
jgi:hypothetical protein